MRKNTTAFFACLGLLILAACAGQDTQDSLRCPTAGLVQKADILPVFVDPLDKDNLDIKLIGYIDNYRGGCKFIDKKNEALFRLEIDFSGQKTNQTDGLKSLRLPYFIAVLSDENKILSKESFWVKLDFDKKSPNSTTTEKHDVRIPIEDITSTHSYKIALGFELTQKQFEYNNKEKP